MRLGYQFRIPKKKNSDSDTGLDTKIIFFGFGYRFGYQHEVGFGYRFGYQKKKFRIRIPVWIPFSGQIPDSVSGAGYQYPLIPANNRKINIFFVWLGLDIHQRGFSILSARPSGHHKSKAPEKDRRFDRATL